MIALHPFCIFLLFRRSCRVQRFYGISVDDFTFYNQSAKTNIWMIDLTKKRLNSSLSHLIDVYINGR